MDPAIRQGLSGVRGLSLSLESARRQTALLARRRWPPVAVASAGPEPSHTERAQARQKQRRRAAGMV